ncbi:cupredoxin domain-containing protein [Nocardioides houyundeii]|uniref:cupredoxin domain-containing protein n=1 Tax=Nocardioides houyundeii TaxID=2045452 RepID=UPI0018EF6A18|nr:cupredoxin domain-containing protein [Nocardioides houyundeii]
MRKTTAMALILAVPLLGACTENASSDTEDGDPRTVSVTSTEDGCELSTTEVPAGTITFEVANQGSQVTEFYLLGDDGLRILGEVENVGPQLTRELVVNAADGSYVTACKPGMKGEGIRADFTVTESDEAPAVSANDQQLVEAALANYAAYVQDQSDQLLTKTQQFVDLYQSGKDAEARALYPRPACTGSGSRPWPSPSATSTR